MMSAAQPTKHTSNASLMQLSEVFPTWKQDELLSVLNEAGGDVYVAISRISEGHVNQWSGNNKKAPSFSSAQGNSRKQASNNNYSDRKPNRESYNDRKTTQSRDNEGHRRDGTQRRQYTPRAENSKQTPSRKTESTTASTVDSSSVLEDLSWGEATETTNFAASVTASTVVSTPIPAKVQVPATKSQINTKKTSFADAAAMAEPKKTPAVAPVPAKAEQITVESNAALEWGDEPEVKSVSEAEVDVEPEPAVVPEPEPEIVIEETKAPVIETVKVQEKGDDDEVVLMPARTTPSLTMEQSPVVLPVRTNIRNVSVRFGFDRREEAVEAKMESVPVVTAAVLQKTPISVAALEGSFATLSAREVGKSSPEQIPIHSVPAASVSPIAPSSFFPVEAVQTSVNPQASFARHQNVNVSSPQHQYQAHHYHQQQQYHQQQHYQEPRSYSSTASTSTSNVDNAPVNNNTSNSFSPRPRQNNWDYDNSVANASSSVASNASFGPAPGFSSPASQPATQRFVSRAAAQYDASAAPPYNANRFTQYDYQHQDESGNNVSQYYTTNNRNQTQSQQSGYPVYRNNNNNNNNSHNNSFNSNRYSNHNSNSNYGNATNASVAASRSGNNSAAAPYHPAAHVNQQQQAQLYSQYSTHQHHHNYMNSYHQHPVAQQSYHHAGHHHNAHGHPEQQQQQHYTSQQAYYQPYQPPTQYLSNQNFSSPNVSNASISSDQRHA